jgi:hypothetical protein
LALRAGIGGFRHQAGEVCPRGLVAWIARNDPGQESDCLEPAPQRLGESSHLGRIVGKPILIVEIFIPLPGLVHGRFAPSELARLRAAPGIGGQNRKPLEGGAVSRLCGDELFERLPFGCGVMAT